MAPKKCELNKKLETSGLHIFFIQILLQLNYNIQI